MKTRVASVYSLLIALWLSHSALVTSAAELEFALQDGPTEGHVVAYVFSDPNSFAELRDPMRIARFAIQQEGQTYTVGDLPPGDYALLVFLDENGNRVLDRNFIGIPREPIAISNNYFPKGPPSFVSAQVAVTEARASAQRLRLRRPLGKFGQISVGLGAITQSSPYVGSDSAQVQPIPAIVYIGERLQVMGPVVNYTLVGSDRVRLALRGGLRIGAYDEDDSPALAGMGDRKSTFLGGLALVTELPGGADVTFSYLHDVLDRIGGGTARVSVSKGFQAGRWRFSPSLSVNWLDDNIANHDFGVAPADARLNRPAYELDGVINWGAGVTGMYEITPAWRLVVSATREQLDSDIAASPIVDQHYLIRGFGAISYTF